MKDTMERHYQIQAMDKNQSICVKDGSYLHIENETV